MNMRVATRLICAASKAPAASAWRVSLRPCSGKAAAVSQQEPIIASHTDLEKEGWKTKFEAKDSVCENTGGKVHEEVLDATRDNPKNKTSETLAAKSRKVVGKDFHSTVVSQSYSFKQTA